MGTTLKMQFPSICRANKDSQTNLQASGAIALCDLKGTPSIFHCGLVHTIPKVISLSVYWVHLLFRIVKGPKYGGFCTLA